MSTITGLAALGLGACSGAPDGDPSPAQSAVLVPGRPGEPNRTLSAADAASQRAEDDSPNAADVAYARDMIKHHEQALEMTGLATEHAASTQVRRLAERIAAVQGPEIAAMESWLESHGRDKGDSRHDHASMPGMATEAQMRKLRAARGEAFDQLFLTLMIAHHEGAISMAAKVKGEGNNIRIEEMADDVVAEQSAEIARMEALL